MTLHDPPASRVVDPANRHIAVVGGGISGLVAAVELARAGVRVSIWERETVLGGRVRAAELAGVQADMGAEAFASRGGAVTCYLAELGLAKDIVYPAPLGSWVLAGDQALPLPRGGAIGIPAQPLSRAARRHLGLGGALRAAIEPWLPRATGKSGKLGTDPTIAALVSARLGSRVLDRLVRPVTLGVYSSDPAQLRLSAVPGLADAYQREGSLIRAAKKLREASSAAGGAVAALPGGMTPLVDALATEARRLGCEIHTATNVAELRSSAPQSWQLRDSNGAALDRADAVLLAVPEPVAHALLGLPGEAPVNAEVEVIALTINDSRLDRAPRGTGALIAAGASGSRVSAHRVPALDQARHDAAAGAATDTPIRAKALTHVTAKWPDRAALRPAGQHVIRLSYGRAGSAPETLALDDAAAYELARQDAARILGLDIAQERVIDRARQRWQIAAPAGPSPRIIAPQGIALAGDWLHGTGLASVIPGARNAAQELFARLVAEPVHSCPSEPESDVRPE